MKNTCPHEKRLTACLLGDLPPAEAAAVRAHLDACPACRAAAAELAPLLDTLRDALAADAAAPLALEPARLAAVLATPPRRQRRVRFYILSPLIGLAATGVIVLGAALLFPAFERFGGATGRSATAADACFETVVAEETPGWRQEVTVNTLSLERAPQAAREVAGTPTPATRVPPTDGTDAGRAFGRGLSELAKAQRMEVDGDGQADMWEELPAGEQADKGGAFLAGAAASAPAEAAASSLRRRSEARADEAASDLSYGFFDAPAQAPKPQAPKPAAAPAPAATAAPGAPPPRKPGAPQSRVAADDAKGDPFAAVAHDQTVAAPAAVALPSAAQPQAVESVLSVRSPVIMNGVGGARRSEGTRGQLMKERKSEAGEHEALGSETYGADKQLMEKLEKIVIPEIDFKNAALEDVVEFFQQATREYDREPRTDEEQIRLAPELSKHDAAKAAEQESASAPITFNARFVTVADALRTVADVAGAKIVERDGALVLEALPPPAEPAARPVPPPPPPLFNPFVPTAERPLSTFAIDVDTASYTLARQSLLGGGLPEPGHIRTEEVVNAFDYGDRAPDHATFRIFVEGAPAPFGRGTALVRLGVKGRRLGREEARPAVLTFVVDASGSMGQPDRIGLARQSLDELLGRLGPEDRVQLIAFNDAARVLADPAPPADRPALLAAFDRLQCTGSTHLEAGLRLAYARAVAAFRPGAENRVILLSDGVANLGSSSADDILGHIDAARRQGITLSVFGLGRGTYSDAMLERLANKGDGVYRFLDSAAEVRRAFVDDLAATLYTIASDVKIQVEWFPAAVSRYRQLGYENRALTAEQFRDDAVDAGEVGSGQAVTALYEIDRAALPARAAADAPLGVVRVRYRPAAGGPVDEISRPILAADLAPTFQAARPAFRVAACAAAFAERLRRSPHAAGYAFADVADALRPAALEFPLDTRIAELLRLVEAADRLSK